MHQKKKRPEPTLQERAQQYIEEDIKLMGKYKLTKRIVVMFPTKGKIPFLGRLGLRMLSWAKGVPDIQFIHKD